MAVDNLNFCATECGGELGPDALEFTHDGLPASGICGQCLREATKIQVIFEKGDDDVVVPTGVVMLESLTTPEKKKKK